MLKKILGAKGERLAADFLQRQGNDIIATNFRFGHGEIDIIIKRGNLISFCEVKTRRSETFGSGEDAVGLKKQAQIRRVAEGYISSRELEGYEYRFDVIVVEIRRNQTRIRVIENAF